MIEIFTGENCESEEKPAFPSHCPPAMAYIPYQSWGETYDVLKGYDKGTVFPVLDKPFYGRRGEPR